MTVKHYDHTIIDHTDVPTQFAPAVSESVNLNEAPLSGIY